eukprot:207056_1
MRAPNTTIYAQHIKRIKGNHMVQLVVNDELSTVSETSDNDTDDNTVEMIVDPVGVDPKTNSNNHNKSSPPNRKRKIDAIDPSDSTIAPKRRKTEGLEGKGMFRYFPVVKSASKSKKSKDKNPLNHTNANKRTHGKRKTMNRINSDKGSANEKHDKKRKPSAEEVIQEGAVLYRFHNKIEILSVNDLRFMKLPNNNDTDTECTDIEVAKHTVIELNRNCYLFTQTRIDTLPSQFKLSGSGMECSVHCESCNEWMYICKENGKELTYSSNKERMIINGFKIIQNIASFRSDTFNNHLGGKNHKRYAIDLQNFAKKPLETAFNNGNKPLGAIPDSLIRYLPVFYAVYFGVIHHFSIQSIIDIKSSDGLLQAVIDFFIEKFRSKITAKSTALHDGILKVINRQA